MKPNIFLPHYKLLVKQTGAAALMPGLSPRDLKRLMKRMGISVEELKGVEKVEIVLSDRKIVIDEPQVISMKSRGENIFQIVGKPREEPIEKPVEKEKVEISEEDIDFIVAQTGVSREEARKALVESGGDLAEAILKLKGEG
jgi:nascent polypeptide-associated complex subunit alpha